MAEMNVAAKGGKKGKPKKLSTRVDFTPMVDLGFLLITFFMLTTSLIKPQTMEVAMPSKDKPPEDKQVKVNFSQAVTIILGKNDSIYYYIGTRKEKENIDPVAIGTTFAPDGIRKILLEKNMIVVNNIIELKNKKVKKLINDVDYKYQDSVIRSDKSGPTVIIKAMDESSYKNFVDILDEMQICNVARFAVVDITDYDKSLINKKN